MTVSDVYEDHRKPVITIRYGATESLVENHRFPLRSMAEEAAAQIRAHRLGRSAWPTHVRPARPNP
jgi:hypothetical protein